MHYTLSAEVSNRVSDAYENLSFYRAVVTCLDGEYLLKAGRELTERLIDSFISLLAVQNKVLTTYEKSYVAQHIQLIAAKLIELHEEFFKGNTSSMPQHNVLVPTATA